MTSKSNDHAAAITAAARKQTGRTGAVPGDDDEVIASLQSLGAIASDEDAGDRVSHQQSNPKQQGDNIIASLRAMGIIGDEEANK